MTIFFLNLLLNYAAPLLLHNVVSSTPRLSGIRTHSCFFLKYCSLVIKQQSINQRMKLIINKFIYAFPISTPFIFTFLLYFCSRAKSRADNNLNINRVIVFIIISNTFTLKCKSMRKTCNDLYMQGWQILFIFGSEVDSYNHNRKSQN